MENCCRTQFSEPLDTLEPLLSEAVEPNQMDMVQDKGKSENGSQTSGTHGAYDDPGAADAVITTPDDGELRIDGEFVRLLKALEPLLSDAVTQSTKDVLEGKAKPEGELQKSQKNNLWTITCQVSASRL